MSGMFLRWTAPATKWQATRQDLALVAMIVATLLMPIPIMLADMLIATNIGLALLMIMVKMCVGQATAMPPNVTYLWPPAPDAVAA